MKVKDIDLNKYIEINDISEIQMVLKFIFKKFHDFCKENNLIYNMFGGTMLGAVRHQDIIPWDDDIDVTMPRNDYNKLDDLLKNNNLFELKGPEDKYYIYPFKKLCLKKSILLEHVKDKYNCLGAYIDIFPADGYPQNDLDVEKLLKKNKSARGKKIGIIKFPRKLWKKILFPAYYVVFIAPYQLKSLKKNLQVEISTLSSNKIEDNDFMLLHGAGWGRRGKIEKSIYYDRKLYKFGDFEAYGVADYNKHLTRLYGDYMKLPPEEKRCSNHNYHLYIDKKLLEEIANAKR